MADFAEEIAGVIYTVADKVKEYSEYARLNAIIKAEQAKMHEQYYRLGKKYYELYKDAPASDLTEITDKIVASEEKIVSLKEELKKAKEAGYTDVDAETEEDVDVEDIAETVEAEEAAEAYDVDDTVSEDAE